MENEDQSTASAPDSSDIYAMCMESGTADQFSKWLCEKAGVDFPPVIEKKVSQHL